MLVEANVGVTTGCSAGIDIKFLLNARARMQPIS